MEERKIMKCPNCGKKMKKAFCTKCGYNPEGNKLPNGSKVNYYTYSANNPNVVYPLTVSGVAQVSPNAVAPISKKEAKLAKKKAKLDMKAMPRKQRKIAKKAAKRETKLAASVIPSSNILSRLFGLVLAVVGVLALAVLSFEAVVSVVNVNATDGTNGVYRVADIQSLSLLNILMAMVDSDAVMFSFLPSMNIIGDVSVAYNLAIYAFLVCAIVATITALGALFSKEKAPARIRKALLILGLGALAYSVVFAITIDSTMIDAPASALALAGFYFDKTSLVLGAGCLVLCLLLKIFKKKSK